MRLIIGTFTSCLLAIASANAQVGADASIGTQGLSFQAQAKILPVLVLRGGVHALDFEIEDREFDGIDYDVELGFTQFGGYADLHPFANGFALTAGILLGERQFDLTAAPTEDVEVGDVTFSPEEIGTLVGSADFGDQAFYAGFGFDNTVYGQSRFTIVFRAGVILTDEPEISLDNVGGIQDPLIQAEIDAELARERASLQDDAKDFKAYPAINIGLGFRF
ncbi:MAG: hypothetical protein V2I43_11110 [Parvularcula sp.]|jgi:hypothetical protein|nr:hypothetical protein [Parvularcula sp.]